MFWIWILLGWLACSVVTVIIFANAAPLIEDFEDDYRVVICTACGYQWNETAASTFDLDCPVCDSNTVHLYVPEEHGFVCDED